MTDTLMLALYQAFEDSKQDFIDANVEPVAFIDRFRGQPLNPEQYEYFPLPAIFIGRAMQWQKVGQCYNGNMALDFHLVTEPTWEASSIATNKEEGLKYYRWVNAVRRVLDNFGNEELSELLRGLDREVDSGVVVYEVITYTTVFYEAEPETATATPEHLEEYDSSLVKTLRR